MGNAIVIPSFQDWYAADFRKMGVTNAHHLESGTFFMVFRGTINGKDYVLKAYEYNSPLQEQPEVIRALALFKTLEDQKLSIPNFSTYSISNVKGTTAYIARPFYSTSLEDLMTFQQPPITNVEKTWIAFQIASSILKLHSQGVYHSDLKPSNVFVEQSFSTYVTDLAPFKPRTISPNRMNFYYHFFTTNGSQGYYLAPERFSNDPLAGNDLDMKAADLFSLGCVLYFIFSNGKHLFDVTSGMKYGSGKLDVTDKLEQIKKKSMRTLIAKLISLDPTARVEAIPSILASFPEQMGKLNDIFHDFSKTEDYNTPETLKKITDIVDLGAPKYRMIIIDFMSKIINGELKVDDLSYILSSYLNFLIPLPDEVKINRAIPTLALLMERFKEPVVHKIVLDNIIKILKTIHTIPVEFRGIFSSFLNPIIEKICKAHGRHSSFRDMLIVAYFLPQYAVELERLAPITFERVAIDFSYITTTDNYEIFNAYVTSLLKYSKCGFRLLNTFLFSLLSTFNLIDEAFKVAVLKVFRSFYEKASNNEIKLFGEQCNESILPVCQDLLTRKISDVLLISIIQLLYVAFNRGMADITFGYALLPVLTNLSKTESITVKYNIQMLLNILPTSISEISLIKIESPKPHYSQPQTSSRKSSRMTPKYEIKMPKISPHFLTSVRRDVEPIRLLKSVTTNRFLSVQGDSRIRIWEYMPTNNSLCQNRMKMFRSRIETASILSPKSLALGFSNGEIDVYDLGVFQKSQIDNVTDALSTSITTLTDTTFLATFNNGSVALYDSRVIGKLHTFQFEDIYDITTSASLYNSDCLVDVGFSEGVFATIDSRVMKVAWLGACPPVKHLVPMNTQNSESSVTVANESSAVLLTEPYHNLSYIIKTDDPIITPYKGGAVVLSNENAWFMHDSGCVAISDDASFSPEVKMRSHPLSMHTSRILCASTVSDFIVTGDETGIINISTMDKASLK